MRVDFVSDRISYVPVRDCRCDITVLMCMHQLKITDDMRGKFYEEKSVYWVTPRSTTYEKIVRENTEPKNGNGNLHGISNDSDFGLVNFGTSKKLIF